MSSCFHPPILVSGLILILTWGLSGCASHDDGAPSSSQVEVVAFRDDLVVDGEWLQVEDWGWAWAPYGVWADWRPYTHGCWVPTSLGFSWYSYWDWGWICFHYGRWLDHPRWGWVWVPDRQWAPAWVAWQDGPDYLGWAPLPPQCRWRADRGLDGDDVWRRHVPDRSWSFVSRNHFDREDLRDQIHPVPRNRELLDVTHDVTRYQLDDGGLANRSLDRDRLAADLKRPIPEREIVWSRNRPTSAPEGPDGRSLTIHRPTDVESVASAPRPQPRTSVETPRPRETLRSVERPREMDLPEVHRQLDLRRAEESRRLDALRAQDAASRSRVVIERRAAVEKEESRREVERENEVIATWRERDREPAPRNTRSTTPRFQPEPKQIPQRRTPARVDPRTVDPGRETPTTPRAQPTNRSAQPANRSAQPTNRSAQPVKKDVDGASRRREL